MWKKKSATLELNLWRRLHVCIFFSLPPDHSFCFNKGGHAALLRRGQGLFPGKSIFLHNLFLSTTFLFSLVKAVSWEGLAEMVHVELREKQLKIGLCRKKENRSGEKLETIIFSRHRGCWTRLSFSLLPFSFLNSQKLFCKIGFDRWNKTACSHFN